MRFCVTAPGKAGDFRDKDTGRQVEYAKIGGFFLRKDPQQGGYPVAELACDYSIAKQIAELKPFQVIELECISKSGKIRVVAFEPAGMWSEYAETDTGFALKLAAARAAPKVA